MSGAQDQVARLLTLVPMVHAHGALSLGEAAEALGVSPDQVLRDLRVLFMCGLPGGLPDDLIDVDIDALEGERGKARPEALIRLGNVSYLARPLRLTPVEASAIGVALQALRLQAEPDTAAIIDRVAAKLAAAAASAPVRITPDPVAPAEPAALGPVRAALESGRQLELVYYVPARDERSVRVVDPHALATFDGQTYLDAWCHAAEGARWFRLDRIEDATVLDSPVTTAAGTGRPGSEGLFGDGDTRTVTLRLGPRAHWVVEYYPVLAQRPVPDDPDDPAQAGRLDVDLEVADPGWLTHLLLRLAPNASVIDPPELDAVFREAAASSLRLYTDPPRTLDPPPTTP
ncbi:helix-turn-helix transcriptional regulator [Nocardioides sp.]|uniref:helix-turn-helix transcriptional regulator n=1 Tax=Nocardioides sp. TaxID=35761 RepID=UPI003514E7F0